MRQLIFILLAIIGVSQAQTIQYIGAPTTTVISRGNFRTDSIFYLPKRTKAPTDTAAFRYQISDSSLYVWTGSQWIKAGGSGTLAGTGTNNYIPKFTGVSTIGNSRIFDNGTNIGFGVDTPNYRFHFQADRASMKLTSTGSLHPYIDFTENTNTLMGFISAKTNGGIRIGNQSLTVRFIVDSSGFVGLGTNIVPTQQLDVDGKARIRTIDSVSTAINMLSSDANGLIVKSVLPIQGSGTSNKVPKFTATRTIADGIITDNGSNIGINTTPSSWSGFSAVQIKGAGFIGDNTYDAYGAVTSNTYYDGSNWKYMSSIGGAARHDLDFGEHKFFYAAAGTAGNNITFTRGMTLTVNGELLVNTTTDNGDYKLQVSGNIYNTGSAVLAATSGNVGIGLTSPQRKLSINVPFSANGEITHLISGQTGVTPLVSITATAVDVSNGATAMAFYTYGPNSGSSQEKMRLTDNGELLINFTSDQGDYRLQVSGNIYNTGSITTGAPSGGSIKPWKIGEAATVSPTSPNRTLRVEVDGVVYYIHAKTTND